jgi:hypothetical protein
MATMAVDLTTGIKGNINNNNMNNNINNSLNNQHTAVDLSLPKDCINKSSNLVITSSITNSDDTMDILKTLVKVTGSDITVEDKSQIKLTALNLLCLAGLQEMLTKGPKGRHPPTAHLLNSQLGSSSSPWNRKMYSCDYEGCGKVGNIILLIYLNTLEKVKNMVIGFLAHLLMLFSHSISVNIS